MSDKKSIVIKTGEFLYRCRAVIAVPFFVILVVFSIPAQLQILSCIFILGGLLIRIWAAGYIGLDARASKFASQYLITNGPFQYLKHPLYTGNLFLVLGVTILFNPPVLLAALLVVLFVMEYSIIICSEINYLKNLSGRKVKFKLRNAKNEISTVLVVVIIYLIYLARY